MSNELEARLDRLEAVVGGLLDELMLCKEALQGAEKQLVLVAKSTKSLQNNDFVAQQRQAQLGQMQNARAMSQLQASAAAGIASAQRDAASNQITGQTFTDAIFDGMVSKLRGG